MVDSQDTLLDGSRFKMAEHTNPYKPNFIANIKNNLLNKSKLKTAFKIWLFFAVLKAIGVICVWFGFLTLIHHSSGDGDTADAPFGRSMDSVSLKGNNSDFHSGVARLACALSKLNHILDSKANIYQVKEGRDQHLERARYILQDSSISKDDIYNFVAFGDMLKHAMDIVDIGTAHGSQGQPSSQLIKAHLSTSDKFRLKPGIRLALSKHLIKTKRQDHAQLIDTVLSKPNTVRLHKGSTLYPWQQWENRISPYRLYDESGATDHLLQALVTAPVVAVNVPSTSSDSQLKLLLKLQDGTQAIFNPMRVSRDKERSDDVYFWHDWERHHSDIAAFHLDRILEFHRVPPAVGRFINLTSDIEPFAGKDLKDTIYTSPVGNKCVHGTCGKYCDPGHPVCGIQGRHDIIEGSMTTWLPFTNKRMKKHHWVHPWRRSHSMELRDEWEMNDKYCDVVRRQPQYQTGRRLLDIMDITVLDYLTGNQDRSGFDTLKIHGNESVPILHRNGHGFGVSRTDDSLILTPIVQCCLIRHSTLHKLIRVSSGPETLSIQMKRSLDQDPLSTGPHGPILTRSNLESLDRRVHRILDQIWTCVDKHGADHVIIDDGF